jgi:hypothetical protein
MVWPIMEPCFTCLEDVDEKTGFRQFRPAPNPSSAYPQVGPQQFPQ